MNGQGRGHSDKFHADIENYGDVEEPPHIFSTSCYLIGMSS